MGSASDGRLSACQPDVEPVAAGERCTGMCCRVFFLPWSHDELAAWWRGDKSDPRHVDAKTEMVLSIARPLPDHGTHSYTCAVFDGIGCTAYAARPRMCSAYPYGRRCEHGKLCASVDARRGVIDYPERQRVRLPVYGFSGNRLRNSIPRSTRRDDRRRPALFGRRIFAGVAQG